VTRSEAIRAHCKSCYGDEHSASGCELVECPLWRFRKQTEDKTAPGVRVTRGKAIRLFCLECMCGQTASVRECPSAICHLLPYRMGKNVA
jgi:hypothetical protein